MVSPTLQSLPFFFLWSPSCPCRSEWVDHTKSKPIANKLTNYLLTGTLDGKPGQDGEQLTAR